MCDYREELDSAVDYQRSITPAAVRAAIGEAESSLYNGPSAGRWQAPLAIISLWAESVDDVRLVDFATDDDGDECEVDAGLIESSAIIAAIVGRELARYV